MTFDQYVVGAAEYRRDNPEQRMGQAYFNFLHYCRPDITDAVLGSALDPFFNDRFIAEFLEFVAKQW